MESSGPGLGTGFSFNIVKERYGEDLETGMRLMNRCIRQVKVRWWRLALGALLATGLAIPAAQALQIQCSEGFRANAYGARTETVIGFDEKSSLFTESIRLDAADGPSAATMNVRAVRGAQVIRDSSASRRLSIQSPRGETLATIEVGGHPLKPRAQLILADGNKDCVLLDQDPAPLFERLIDDSGTRQAIAAWKAWIGSRPAACDPALESKGYFQPGAEKKIALVFHGFASNPLRMQKLIELLLEKGYNVLVPRFSRHFEANLKSLDRARYSEWIKDSEDAFQLARAFAPEVTLAGFSMGGMLASRLALKYPDEVNRMVLIAPAWRTGASLSLGTAVGNWFKVSLDRVAKYTVACKVDQGYVPSSGGRQVEHLIAEIEGEFDGSFPGTFPTAFNKIIIPHLVFTTPKDEAVDSRAIGEMCANRSVVCSQISVPGRTHTVMVDDLTVKTDSGTSMREEIEAFVNP